MYRTYNIQQDGQEHYVDGLLEDFAEREHDAGLEREWLATLALLYTPSRYLLHGLQMGFGLPGADGAGQHHQQLCDFPGW